MVEWREKRRKKTNIPFILCQTVNVHSKWQRPPKNSNQNRFERPKHWMFQTERKYRNKNWKTHTIIVSLTPARCLLVSLILSPVAVVSQLTRYTCTHTHSCASLAYTHTRKQKRARSLTDFDSHMNRSSIAEAQIKLISFHYCAMCVRHSALYI